MPIQRVLRDSAPSVEDYTLWKTHELDDVRPDAACPWAGSERLLEEALGVVVVVRLDAAARRVLEQDLEPIPRLRVLPRAAAQLGEQRVRTVTAEREQLRVCRRARVNGVPCQQCRGRMA